MRKYPASSQPRRARKTLRQSPRVRVELTMAKTLIEEYGVLSFRRLPHKPSERSWAAARTRSSNAACVKRNVPMTHHLTTCAAILGRPGALPTCLVSVVEMMGFLLSPGGEDCTPQLRSPRQRSRREDRVFLEALRICHEFEILQILPSYYPYLHYIFPAVIGIEPQGASPCGA